MVVIRTPPDVIPFGAVFRRDAGPSALWPRRKTFASGQDVWLAAPVRPVVVPMMEELMMRGHAQKTAARQAAGPRSDSGGQPMVTLSPPGGERGGVR